MIPITVRLALLLLLVAVVPVLAVEGMFPVNDLDRLDLAADGIQVTAARIFSAEGGLVDGICKVNGCTGSFVSHEGLILTNHHCAFRAVQAASDRDHDFLADGFVARARVDEAPAVGYTVRITEGFIDVSEQVLDAVTTDLDPLERTRAVERRIKELETAAEKQRPDLRAEVAEMFRGRTYLMFFYTYLKDVRLVYAPPKDVGNFGGEEDNWIWPRHTGDFSFMRAYVAPDGSPAEYHEDNVPYRPRVTLKVSAAGVQADDPVFVLGYPGRTYRHRSAAFLRHEAEVRMPWIVDWYGWQIETLEDLVRRRPDAALRLASRLKGLHNTHKNYRGKLQGIERLDLVPARRDADRDLAAWIDGDADRRRRFGTTLAVLEAFYAELDNVGPGEYWLRNLLHSSAYTRLAFTIYEATKERQKPDLEREVPYMDRNFDQTLEELAVRVDSVVPDAERAILLEILRRGSGVGRTRRPQAVAEVVGEKQRAAAELLVDDALACTNLDDLAWCRAAAQMTPENLVREDDPFVAFVASVYPAWERQREEQRRRRGELDELLSALTEARQERLGAAFVPDANGTLRLSWGWVEGYEPRDAVRYEPITTVRGLLEKDRGEPPYRLPARLRDQAASGDRDVPVCLLYSTDTVGGNSGSPVLCASGELVGLNFDRPWEATINDYGWDAAWSRSIGVDIRYVLWVVGTVDGAVELLAEMGVDG